MEHLWKNHAEKVHRKIVPHSLLILVNNPKQALHTSSYFKNNILKESY